MRPGVEHSPNWADVEPLWHVEETVQLTIEQDTNIFAVRTMTTLTVNTSFILDPDDGLPLANPGERTYEGDGKLYRAPEGAAYPQWYLVAEHKI